MPKPIALLPKPTMSPQTAFVPEWWSSPYARELIEATAFMAGGQDLKAALILRDVIRALEGRGADRSELAPVLRLSADAWRRAAARFSSPDGEQLSNIRQRMRVEFLSEARAAYRVLSDFPSMVRMTRAMADAHMAQRRYLSAAQLLEKNFDLPTRRSVMDITEAVPFLKQLAEAFQLAFEKYSTRRSPSFLVTGPKAAGYLYLTSDNPQTSTYLEMVADRYAQVSKIFHQKNRHVDALEALLQGLVLEATLGREDVVAQHADRIVQYAILTGDRHSLAIYDRAMHLAQNGSVTVANAIIREQAQKIFIRSANFEALEEFHEVVDRGMDYVSRLAGNAFYEGTPNDAKILGGLWLNVDVIFRQAMAWVRTLEMLALFRNAPRVHQLGMFGIERLRYGSVLYTSSMISASAYYPFSHNHVPASPDLTRLIERVSPDGPLDMNELQTLLARQAGCTPAEVAAAFTPYGDVRIINRIKAVAGELMFAQIRQVVLTHHYTSLRKHWHRMPLGRK